MFSKVEASRIIDEFEVSTSVEISTALSAIESLINFKEDNKLEKMHKLGIDTLSVVSYLADKESNKKQICLLEKYMEVVKYYEANYKLPFVSNKAIDDCLERYKICLNDIFIGVIQLVGR